MESNRLADQQQFGRPVPVEGQGRGSRNRRGQGHRSRGGGGHAALERELPRQGHGGPVRTRCGPRSGGRRGFERKGNRDELLRDRKWYHVRALQGTGGVRLRVMTYNVLADYLACEHRRELYSRVPGWALDWKNRLKLLVEEVLHHSPDVLCLQEVDCMDDLREALQPTGYAALFTQRSNGRQDGCAMFWKESVVRAVSTREVLMDEHWLRDNVAQLVLFECGGGGQNTDMHVVIANTHLLFNPKRGDIKIAQLRVVAGEMRQLAAQIDPPAAAVLAGDLNLAPGSPLYQFLRTGELDCLSVDRRYLSGQVENGGGATRRNSNSHQYHRRQEEQWQSQSPGASSLGEFQADVTRHSRHSCHSKTWENGWMEEHLEMAMYDPLGGAASGQIATAKLGLELASSHAAALGQEPRFTTAHDKSVCTVDYIWFTPRGVPDPESRGKRVTTADVSAILLAPSKAVLGKGLPSAVTGSDHICQACELRLHVDATIKEFAESGQTFEQ